MTTILGYTDEKTGISYLASDTQATGGYTKMRIAQKKAYHIEGEAGAMIGFAGRPIFINEFRVAEGLLNELHYEGEEAPTERPPVNVMNQEFILKHFTLSSRTLFEMFADENEPTMMIGVINKHLFIMEASGTTIFVDGGIEAIGSGAEYAKATMFALRNSRMSVEKKLKKAMECASHFDAGTGGDFYVISDQDLEVKKL